MTREEVKNYIGELKMYAKSQGWDEEYLIACDIAMNELEQETVSKESYDHEYFLRKEFELKIDKLQRQLGNIRAEIANYQKEAIYSDYVVMPKRMVLDIIDKYKAESEE